MGGLLQLGQHAGVDADDLPPHLFDRVDPSPDGHFYAAPRFVTHIDDETIAALRDFYGEVLAEWTPEGALLDLMSSWVSHLPPSLRLERVAGLGMNAAELEANPRLDEHRVVDLNATPALPWDDASFDAVVNAVSIQYLTRPVEVYAEVARVLRPGGISIVAMSHRCFPTKAIRAFQQLPPDGRVRFVAEIHARAGGFEPAAFVDRSPDGADPLWLVVARKASVEPAS